MNRRQFLCAPLVAFVPAPPADKWTRQFNLCGAFGGTALERTLLARAMLLPYKQIDFLTGIIKRAA